MKIALMVNGNPLAHGTTAMLLVLAGLLGVSQPTSAADGEFINLSTRAYVGTGDEVMIGGFIIEDGARRVLIQARGPELANDGISNALTDPVLTVIRQSDGMELMVNDNWEDSQGQLVSDLWRGSPNLMAGSLSSAAVLTLDPGRYTAKIDGKNGTAGVAMVEVYGIDFAGADGRLVNLSTRSLVGTGEEVMIGGFIIEDGARQVLIQARGPELANDGISNALADPVLTVIRQSDGMDLMINDNWEDSQGQLVSDLWRGSPNLTAGSLSSAAVLTLDPGRYTAKIDGKNGTAGVAMVEVYGIDSPGTGSPDRVALTALYVATNGANWTRSDNWDTNAPLDQWHGVTVDDNGRVIGLDLSANQLSGTIPAELGELTNLQSLNLGRNALSGTIPAELGNLTNLTWLRLAGNMLSGVIPPELGQLGNLQRLDLDHNQLSGRIPSWLGNLTNLYALDLASNQLSGTIPPELGNLTNLRSWLNLYDNQLSGVIPAELGNLINLEELLLHENQLTGPIPAELGNLGNLTQLWLENNLLSGSIPAELGELANLETIFLGGNQFSGCIPSGLQDVPSGDLSTLGLSYCGSIAGDRAALVALYNATDGANWTNNANWLGGSPLDQWHGVTVDDNGRVIELSLSSNLLNGVIPTDLGNLTKLEKLWLYDNQLSGPIPADLGGLANLETLNLRTNQLNGLIPAELGNLAYLQYLGLHDNQLSGAIPAELGQLANLETLGLYANQLSGSIPVELGNLANLEGLYLQENKLSGPIPAELGRLTNLGVLALYDNQLSGPIPTQLANLSSLQYLGLQNNRLNGAIPTELGQLANLQRLVLRHNQLSGSIPAELGSITNLEGLWLDHNQLSGPIPAELGELANLGTIYIGGSNQLTGCLPSGLWAVADGDLSTLGLQYCGITSGDRAALVALYNATEGANWTNNANWLSGAPLGDWHGVTTDDAGRVSGLDLAQNNLSGPVPAALGNLGNLQTMELQANRLSGPIPVELGRLTNLKGLVLYGNRLSGPIPAELGELANLVFLQLSSNQLNGLIPPELGKLTNLGALVLSSNQLSGPIPAELGDLANLEAIFLGGNQFSGCIPSGLQRVPQNDLSTLGLQYCGIANDRAALVALYNATDGTNWTNSTNWLTNTLLKDWYGVTTNDAGWVSGLDLGNNNLSGPIPAALGELTNLTDLVLAENQLSGPIPLELGNLTNLEMLALSGNLTGSIPPELGNLANLETLTLAGAGLTGSIPPELGNLSNLKVLVLQETQLSGPIPAELGKLANLETLILRHNRLSGPIPPELGNLLQLEGLLLHDNLLTGPVPDSFLGLHKLEALSIARNNGLCLPATDAFLSSGGFEFEGSFCQGEDRAALVALYEATGGANWTNNANWLRNDLPLQEWAGVATDAEGRVAGLDLSSNNLVGSIPPELGSLSQLRYLTMDNNQLTGSIPSELGSLANLVELSLNRNNLSGPIPLELGNLANLEWLNLADNNLSGPISPELGNLANLEVLGLHDNFLLSGQLPLNLAKLPLKLFWYSDTGLCVPAEVTFKAWLATIPEHEGTETSCAPRDILTALYEATDGPNWTQNTNWGTNLPIDQWYGVTTDASGAVTHLHLGDNNLTGAIPPQLGNLAALTTLALHQNNLSGPIPPQLGNLANLADLNIWGNRLSGSIPSELGSLTNLWQLVLASNDLSGPIPPELGNLANLVVLHLNNNNLTGSIPGSFLQLDRLTTFHADIYNCVPETAAFPAWLQRIPDRGASLCTEVDRAALVALYEATDGPNWTNNSNWLTNAPLGDWHGITTDDTGRVFRVDLPANNLTGPIPYELGALYGLTRLAFHQNHLTGSLPSELDGLASLQYLNLSENQLNGPIPPELGNLANLGSLELGSNNFTGSIPPELGNLAALTTLALHQNNLSGPIPFSLDRLASLQYLNLSENQLVGLIPVELGNLVALTSLALHQNNLSGPIPPQLGNLANLADLNIWGNRLSGSIPSELGSLTNLWQLVLAGNDLSGRVPPELGNLGNTLVVLQFHENNLTGQIPDSFLQLQQLVNFHADFNNCIPETAAFTAWLQRIPDRGATLCPDADRASLVALYEATDGPNWTNNSNWLTNAPLGDWHGITTDDTGRVSGLALGYNKLSGTIPSELGNLANLTNLRLAGNQLSGPIPPELGHLANLQSLELEGSNLTGSIPPEIGNLANLAGLALHNNQLSGPVPPELGNLTNLWILGLESNNLTGSIPPEIGNLANLAGLGLGNNNLTGTIPPELGNLANLQFLYLWGNRLSGSIPSRLGNLTNLLGLDISNNNLTGAIPPEIGNLTNLVSLWLRRNNLTGPIPPELGNLANLGDLSLQGNNLTGTIPESFLRIKNLTEFRVDFNNCVPETAAFSAWLQQIPLSGASLCTDVDRAALVALYEATDGSNWTNSDNWLTNASLGDWHGVTTDALGRVSRLDLLYNNNLTGTIPPELGNLANLTTLALHNNNLTGTIPPELGNLANLDFLTLSHNDLSGPIPPELGNLANLTNLRLSYNQLSGQIPSDLGNLAKLVDLHLIYNNLTGTIPDSFLKLQGLKNFYISSYNCVPDTAVFTAWLQQIPTRGATLCTAADRWTLVSLYRATGGPNWTNSDNWETDDPLKDWYGVTTDDAGRVVSLALPGNNLTGTIPPRLGSLANLRTLELHNNNLTGFIPGALGHLTNLITLNLGDNNLGGRIPSQIGNLTNLQQLFLSGNNLTSPIPSEIGSLANLVGLELHDNDFQGAFPTWLPNLRNLIYLTLKGRRQTCLPANDHFRDWVGDLRERGIFEEIPPYCGDGFWFTWRFEQTTTGRAWTGKRPFAAHRIKGKPMLLRIFMGMDNNNHLGSKIKSPRMEVIFNEDTLNESRVEVPEGVLQLSATRDEAFRLDSSYSRSINIVIPGHLPRRGRDPSIQIHFDPDGTFREMVGNRMPRLPQDLTFGPIPWRRDIDYGQTYEILSGYDPNPRTGWPIQEVPPAKIALVPLVKSKSDDKGMIKAVKDLVRKGPNHVFFRETLNLLPIGGLEVHNPVGLFLGYHPTIDNMGRTLFFLGDEYGVQ